MSRETSMMAALRSLASGVRFRTTAVAMIVVGAMLAVAVMVLTVQTRSGLEASITESAEVRASGVASLVEAGAIEDPLPGRSALLFTQVIGPDGTVVAASPGIREVEPFTGIRPRSGETAVTEVDGIFEAIEEDGGIEDEGPYRVVALGVAGTDGDYTVLTAVSLEAASEALGVLSPLLLLVFPVVLVAVGVTVWALTGWALRPVDAMRREAEAISSAELERRLPVPPSRDEVNRLARTLNAMLDRLEAAATRQRRFVSDASHELKSPIAAIRTMLEVVERTPGFDEWDTLVADLLREDRRLERLVQDLLTLARWEEGQRVLRITEVDLDQVVGREAEAAVPGRARLDTDGLEAVRMHGDPAALSGLFRNLLENAARYATSTVWVESYLRNGEVAVLVSDDGPGIPKGEWDRVFDRFVRLDEARSRAEGGTGLGLAVARAHARSHGGDAIVVSPKYGGTTIEVMLPVSARD